jgi:hypothetical protein
LTVFSSEGEEDKEEEVSGGARLPNISTEGVAVIGTELRSDLAEETFTEEDTEGREGGGREGALTTAAAAAAATEPPPQAAAAAAAAAAATESATAATTTPADAATAITAITENSDGGDCSGEVIDLTWGLKGAGEWTAEDFIKSEWKIAILWDGTAPGQPPQETWIRFLNEVSGGSFSFFFFPCLLV